MPRYLVERSFPDGFLLDTDGEGMQRYRDVVERNADPEAVRKTAARNRLPVDRITQVRVLDPYFYAHDRRW